MHSFSFLGVQFTHELYVHVQSERERERERESIFLSPPGTIMCKNWPKRNNHFIAEKKNSFAWWYWPLRVVPTYLPTYLASQCWMCNSFLPAHGRKAQPWSLRSLNFPATVERFGSFGIWANSFFGLVWSSFMVFCCFTVCSSSSSSSSSGIVVMKLSMRVRSAPRQRFKC